MFARLLTDAKEREEELLDSESAIDSRVEEEFLPKLAKQHGASRLIAKVRKLRTEFQDAEGALDDLGFSCDNDSISLKYDAPNRLRQTLEAEKRSARRERERSLKKFDRAILNVWTAESADQAKRIVEPLL